MSEALTEDDIWTILENAECCLWFGLPLCPHCGGDHGDPKCSPENDAQFRAWVNIGKNIIPRLFEC